MEAFLHENSIYLVLGIALMIWFGLAIYLFILDRKVTKLEKTVEYKLNNDLKENY